MTLLESLPALYEYLDTALETMPMIELTMEYVAARLMHGMSKRKEKKPQGKDVTMVSRASKQSRRSTFVTRRKEVLPLWQPGPYCVILLQSKEQGEEKCQQCGGRGRIRICNATWSAFEERLQIDHGFRSHKAHEFA